MAPLSIFITFILPISICIMAIIFAVLAIIGDKMFRDRWNKENDICDELDEIRYESKARCLTAYELLREIIDTNKMKIYTSIPAESVLN